MRHSTKHVLLLAAVACLNGSVSGQVLYSENFDDNNAASRWTVLQGTTSGTLSSLATNYSTLAQSVPAAPRGGGPVGAALDVNQSGNLADALNLYPNGQSFSGDYVFRCDVYMYAPVATDASTMTEFFLQGINTSGTKANFATSGSPNFSDGLWYNLAGDGGQNATSATGDTNRYLASTTAAPTRVKIGQNRDDLSSINLPQKANLAGNTDVGTVINHWATLEVSQVNNVVRMKIDGAQYDEYDNSAGSFTSGNVFIGYTDPFSGSVNADVYGLFDNVEVRRVARFTGANGDSFTDSTKWANGAVPDGIDGYASLDGFGSSAAIVTLNSGVTLGSFSMRSANSYTLTGAGSIIMNSTSGRAAVTASLGTHTIATAMRYDKSIAFTVGAGTSTGGDATAKLTMTGNQTFASGANLFKGGQGELVMPNVRLTGGGSLGIGGGTLTIAHSATNNAASGVSTVQQMYLENQSTFAIVAGALNLNNNTLIYDYQDGFHFYQNYTGAEGFAITMLKSGYAAGAWNGKGINSADAAAAAATNSKTAIGWAEKTDLGTTTFNGQPLPDDTTMVFTYTLVGDANLDYKVNTLDFNLLAASFGDNSQFRSWHDGNFNYDASSVVDSTDFDAFVANYGKTLGAAAPTLGSVVPEPATCSLVGLIGLFGMRRARR